MYESDGNAVILVLGGVRSGKSSYAQQLAEKSSRVTFVATAERRDDEEMHRKIERHRADRPAHWTTVEEPIVLGRVVRSSGDNSDVTKFHGIPGLRVAYAVANEAIARAINEDLPPWPITTLASCAVTSALADHPFAERTRLQNDLQRTRLSGGLDALGIHTYPSAANFLLLRLPDGASLERLWRHMIVEHHMVLRDCSNYEALPCRHLRAAEEKDKLVGALAHSLQFC